MNRTLYGTERHAQSRVFQRFTVPKAAVGVGFPKAFLLPVARQVHLQALTPPERS